MVYDLTEKEVRTLVAAPIEEQPVEKRLELLNGIIGADFSDKVTMEALNSDQRIAIGLHPEVQQDLEQRQRQEQEAFMPVEPRCNSKRNPYRAMSVRQWTGVTSSF